MDKWGSKQMEIMGLASTLGLVLPIYTQLETRALDLIDCFSHHYCSPLRPNK